MKRPPANVNDMPLAKPPVESGALTDGFSALLRRLFYHHPAPWPQEFSREEERQWLALVAHHGIQPLLYHLLRDRVWFSDWPEAVRETLMRQSFAQTALKIKFEGEVQRVLAGVTAAGVDALLMKGLPLAYTLYEYPALRPHGDVDLLIRRGDVEQVGVVMRSLGYMPFTAVPGELVNKQTLYILQAGERSQFQFDIHWRLSNRNLFADLFTFDELAKTGIPVPALGESARTIGWQEALLLACVHRLAHHHNDDRLIWLYDIHLLVERLSADELTEFLQVASVKQVRSVCLDGLKRARQWFDTRLPEALQSEIEKVGLSAAGPLADEYARSDFSRIKRLWAELRHLRGWDRFRFLRELALPRADYMMKRYGVHRRWQLPWFYLKRAISGLNKYRSK